MQTLNTLLSKHDLSRFQIGYTDANGKRTRRNFQHNDAGAFVETPTPANIISGAEADGDDSHPIEPAPLPSPVKTKRVTSIHIEREIAVWRTHARYNTTVWIHRESTNGQRQCRGFETSPVRDTAPRISAASIRRAKRAQNLMLAAQAQMEQDA